MHSNRYIDFNSAHPFSAKISLAPNLFRRANKIIISEEDKQKEQKNVINVLRFNNFPMNIIRSVLKLDVSLQNITRMKYHALLLQSTQNCVYKLRCVDCDGFYIEESSHEILTRAKEHIRYTKKPPNNPVELDRLQIKSAIAAHAIFNNHQIDFKNTKILQKVFPTTKKGE